MIRLTGFFRCVCGKLHTISAFNRTCPQCGVRLGHSSALPDPKEVK